MNLLHKPQEAQNCCVAEFSQIGNMGLIHVALDSGPVAWIVVIFIPIVEDIIRVEKLHLERQQYPTCSTDQHCFVIIFLHQNLSFKYQWVQREDWCLPIRHTDSSI